MGKLEIILSCELLLVVIYDVLRQRKKQRQLISHEVNVHFHLPFCVKYCFKKIDKSKDFVVKLAQFLGIFPFVYIFCCNTSKST